MFDDHDRGATSAAADAPDASRRSTPRPAGPPPGPSTPHRRPPHRPTTASPARRLVRVGVGTRRRVDRGRGAVRGARRRRHGGPRHRPAAAGAAPPAPRRAPAVTTATGHSGASGIRARPDRRRRRGPRLGRHDHSRGRLGARLRLGTSRRPASARASILTADGYILTNKHVVTGSQSLTVELADGRQFPATIVKQSDDKDLALDQDRRDRSDARPSSATPATLQVGQTVDRDRQPARHVHRDRDQGHPVGDRPDDHRPGRGDRPARHADRPPPDGRRDQPRQQRRAAPRRGRAGHRHQHRRLDRRRGPRLRDPDRRTPRRSSRRRRAPRRAEPAPMLPRRGARGPARHDGRARPAAQLQDAGRHAARPARPARSPSSSRGTGTTGDGTPARPRRPAPRRRPPRRDAHRRAGDRVRRRERPPPRPSTGRSSTPGTARSRSGSSWPAARSPTSSRCSCRPGAARARSRRLAGADPPRGGAPGAEREDRHRVGRDLHQRCLHPVAPGGARPGRARVIAARRRSRRLRRVEPIMGTTVSIDVRAPLVPPEVLDDVVEQLRDVEARFSTYRADSEISRLARGEIRLEELQPRRPLRARRLRPPRGRDRRRVRRARASPGRAARSVRLRQGLGDRGGGLADRQRGRPRTTGSTPAGTSSRAARPAPGRPWRVGIRHPDHADKVAAVLAISDRAVATSGDYERGAHIADPRLGRAARACGP